MKSEATYIRAKKHYDRLHELEQMRLLSEYHDLYKIYGLDKIESFFDNGIWGFLDSRLFGNYSMDAIKQTLNYRYGI